MPNINPRDLFRAKILDYPVNTTKKHKTSYVNLDNAATTPPFAVVEKHVVSYLTSYGSVHRGSGTKSQISTDVYEESREVIKKFVNAPKDDYVLFTGNTTGAANTLAYFFSFLAGKVAVSSIEHSSSWLPWIKAEGITTFGAKQMDIEMMDKLNEKIQKLGRAQVLQYDVDDHFEFNLAAIEKLLKENKIKALVVTASSNLTGYCPDIKAIGQLAHKYNAYFIVDACQYLQHHHVDMRSMEIDFLMASGHKFYAPYGGGFLIGPKYFFDNFLPYQIGGGNLPYITEEGEFLRYRNQLAHDPGTPNAVGAISMACALQELTKIGLDNVYTYEHRLAKLAFDYLKTNHKVDLYITEKHLNTIIPFNIKGATSKVVAGRLNDEFGIGVRAGSFCVYHAIRKLLKRTDDKQIANYVRRGYTDTMPQIIRASFALCNTEVDVKRFIEAIKEITK